MQAARLRGNVRFCWRAFRYSRSYSTRSPDYAYIKHLNRHERYASCFKRDTLPSLQKFPKLLENYFTVSAVMKERDLIPLTFAQSALFRPGRVFLETFYGKTPEEKFRYLRDPSQQFRLSLKEVKSRIQDYIQKHGDWDYDTFYGPQSKPNNDPKIRPYVLSTSYHFIESAFGDSASFYAFENRSAGFSYEIEEISRLAIERTLKLKGLQNKAKNICKSIKPIYEQYADLDLGQVFVIGIPKGKIDQYAYDSKAYGIPTGQPISAFCDQCDASNRAYSQSGTAFQGRIFMCKETLQSQSGLEVISLNDKDEVKAYVKDTPYISPRDIPEFNEIFKHESTPTEEAHWVKQAELDQQVREIARALV